MGNLEIKSDSRWASGEGLPSVVTIGDPALRAIAEQQRGITSLKPLCEELVAKLREFKGAGLAASQIGRSEPVVVVEVRRTDLFPDREESPLYVMINPKIVEYIEPIEMGWEGCFSVPGLMAHVPRHQSVKVTWTDVDGTDHHSTFSDYLARVVQHEVDHLQGILFTDRMNVSTLSTVANWKRYHWEDDLPPRNWTVFG